MKSEKKIRKVSFKETISVLTAELQGIKMVLEFDKKRIHAKTQEISYLRHKKQELLSKSVNIERAISKLKENG